MSELQLTRAEILANRQKVIKFLMQPKRLKAIEALDIGNGQRCCLGHMCYSLGIKRTSIEQPVNTGYRYGEIRNKAIAPKELVSMVGLYTSSGYTFGDKDIKIKDYPNQRALTGINDKTQATPQEIGQYLLDNIEGGTDTPWRPLNDYPDTL